MNLKKRPRSGFTLVEMLVVIVVIGILMGLLLAAVAPTLFTSYNFAVTTEIKELEGSIEQFKTNLGFYPPCEFDFDGDTTTDLTADPEDLATFKQYLRKIAPNHDETDAQIGTWWNQVGRHLDNDSILVFWLSGLNRSAQYPLTYSLGADNLYDDGGGAGDDVFTGFANGEDPAKRIFFEFSADQLVDGNATTVKRYLQRKIGEQPYVYFSASQYGIASCNVSDPFNGAPVAHAVYPYRSYPDATVDYYNLTTFQIVAAGRDRTFGSVDGFAPNDNWTVSYTVPDLRDVMHHRDNITNFSGGILEREVQ